MEFTIRLEQESDYNEVENMTREAFWNLYMPGCDEHYLVHKMRSHEDFIPELAFVAAKDEQIIGNIMYTKSYVVDEQGQKHQTLTFGPLCVTPEVQRQGVGKALIEHSKKIAAGMGYKGIIIFGSPANYCRRGFKSAKKFKISSPEGTYPAAMMAIELFEGSLNGVEGKYYGSELFEVDQKAAEEYDKRFPLKEKKVTPIQEEFAIMSQAVLVETTVID